SLGNDRSFFLCRLLRSISRSDSVIYGIEFRSKLFQFIRLPKFEVSATLQQFPHTLGFFDTRQLDKNKTVLFQFLNIGSDHTETVDTSTQYVVRVIHRTIQLVAKNRNHL